jgi:ABC-2 type transport system ATP-binding protein
MTNPNTILKCKGLVKTIKNNQLFEKRWTKTLWKIPNLEVTGPGLTILAGKNGSGKSTLLRALLNLSKPTQGEIIWFDQGPFPGAKVGYVPEFPILPPQIKVRDWLAFFIGKDALNPDRQTQTNALLSAPSLQIQHLLEVPAYRLSKGQFQRVQLWTALYHDPIGIILDEPFSGLDPWARAEFATLLCSYLDQQRFIILSTHEIPAVLRKREMVSWLIENETLTLHSQCVIPE